MLAKRGIIFKRNPSRKEHITWIYFALCITTILTNNSAVAQGNALPLNF